MPLNDDDHPPPMKRPRTMDIGAQDGSLFCPDNNNNNNNNKKMTSGNSHPTPPLLLPYCLGWHMYCLGEKQACGYNDDYHSNCGGATMQLHDNGY
jgi:hypothetical protein